jgi:hypothetical protein
MKHVCRLVFVCAVITLSASAFAQEEKPLLAETLILASPKLQEDFPVLALGKKGFPWVAYVAWDGTADTLKIARKAPKGLVPLGSLAGPGIIHRPAIANDRDNRFWVFWSELDEKTLSWSLKARSVAPPVIEDTVVTIDGESGSAIFADAGADIKGRVWVVWQSYRGAYSDIYAKVYDPRNKKWSKEIQVSKDPAGDWEPRLAFDGDEDGAWVVFDRSSDGVFNVVLARIGLDGTVKEKQITSSNRFQGCATAAAAPDGKGLWLTWESGRVDWGKNSRGVDGARGLNWDKRVEMAYYDTASGAVTLAKDPTPVLRQKGLTGPGAKANAGKRKRPGGGVQTMNRPCVMTDAEGAPWLCVRRYIGTSWQLALLRYDVEAKAWSEPVPVPKSRFGQDRRVSWARDAEGSMWLCRPSDLRTSKRPLMCGIYLSRLEPAAPMPAAADVKPLKDLPPPKPKWGDDTPERTRADRHEWTINGKTYTLYWGDFHRHTDISNCRTAHDGSVVDQFRYAVDIGKLDFLGTSDHTDIADMYGPYEWWHSQKLQDLFFLPGFFQSFYVYEREQRWPWGHRNVVFTERGGPMVYIQRARYNKSPWSKLYPLEGKESEISPRELWDALKAHGKEVTVISHTGATGMGTDWDKYESIDNAVENLVEIYQGARVSYEGLNTPQPTVGFPKDGALKPDAHGSVKTGKDFGKHNNGVYQRALKNEYRLGVFANSDHISTHTSFGGAYAESFTRPGIMEALNARRTIAATDKIFVHYTCNGHLLGTIFDTSDKPELSIAVKGTAPLVRVTIVRNETDYKIFDPAGKSEWQSSFTDPDPIEGENRYYLRIEQNDGNMAWASPVWATYKP